MATWAGPPRSYTKGRGRPVQYVVIHSTEGSEGVNSAEAGVAYDKVRTDGTSCHLFVDTDTALMEVRYSDTAHAARKRGNACGIQLELCGRAGQSDGQWHDAASLPMLRLAAKEVAAICAEFDLPVKRLSVAEVRAAYYAPEGQRPKGICGHIDVTKAYPEDQGSHTDPGPNFPWSEFLAMVQAELDGEDDMGKVFLIKAQDTGRVYRVTEPVSTAQYMAPELVVPNGPVSNAQVHQPGLLGPLYSVSPGTKGWTPDGRMFLTGGDISAWGHVVGEPGGTEPGGGLTEAEVRDIAGQEADKAIAGTTLVPGK